MTDDWQILGTYPQANGQFKVTARRGGQVAHIDRLTAEQIETFGPDDVAIWWERFKR